MYVFLNERIVPECEAMISVYDHGFLYGDGIYETMRAYRGTVFMLESHLERLSRSASFIKLGSPKDDFIRKAVYMTLEANQLTDAYIRVTVSRGKGPVGLDPELCKRVTFVVIAEKFKYYPESFYANGTYLVLAGTRRNSRQAIDPRIKSLNFLNNILAKIEAKAREAHEAIMLNGDGFIAEGTVSNIFFVKNDTLCTPGIDVGILDGITRELVIRIARSHGIPVEEGAYYPEDLFSAKEVFFTNTTSEIMPVSRVEHVSYKPGDITRSLQELFKKEVIQYLENHKSGFRHSL